MNVDITKYRDIRIKHFNSHYKSYEKYDDEINTKIKKLEKEGNTILNIKTLLNEESNVLTTTLIYGKYKSNITPEEINEILDDISKDL